MINQSFVHLNDEQLDDRNVNNSVPIFRFNYNQFK